MRSGKGARPLEQLAAVMFRCQTSVLRRHQMRTGEGTRPLEQLATVTRVFTILNLGASPRP